MSVVSINKDNRVCEKEPKTKQSKSEIRSKENKRALREWLQINGSPFYRLLK